MVSLTGATVTAMIGISGAAGAAMPNQPQCASRNHDLTWQGYVL
jgi:hypothetical protein